MQKEQSKNMQDKIYKCIIIGGGFSGLVLTDKLLDTLKSDELLVLERNDRVGKKIAVTGNGRGNVSNKDLSVKNYHGGNPSFCAYAIENYDNADEIKYFERLGILFCEENGKYYPAGFQASSVLDALRFSLAKKGANILTQTKVDEIKKSDGKFIVVSGDKKYAAENLAICTGGKAQKQFGTDGSFFDIIKKLSHTVTPLYPSLVQIRTDKESIKGLKGIKQKAKLTLFEENKEIKSFTGDLLFTDFGISGDSCFRLSAYLENKQNCSIKAEFLPDIDKNHLTGFLKNKISYGIIGEEVLNGVINKQLGKVVIKQCGLNLTDVAAVNSAEKIADKIENYRFSVVGTLGFDYAQVTHGGVNTQEIDPKTMESTLIKGLYFAGEVIDIDGDCGGYNLQWAYSSASVAAKAILSDKC